MSHQQSKAGASHFDENQRKFSNRTTKGEQFNLYGGLHNMALAVHEQGERIESMERQLKEIVRLLKIK